MTIHYNGIGIKHMNALLVINGWNYHNRSMPICYAILCHEDAIAFNCWRYLDFKKVNTKIDIDKFCKKMPEEYREKIKEILEEIQKFAKPAFFKS